MGTRVRLHRLGEHRQNDDIEESCAVMDVMDGNRIRYRVVIDCGLHPNHGAKMGEKGWLAPNLDFFRDGKLIDAMLITHAHTDHVGYVPALVPFMAEHARFWATRTTAAMLEHSLTDGISIAEGNGSPLPYTSEQMFECLDRMETFNRPGPGTLPGSNMELLVWPAGHIPGACSFTFKVGSQVIHYAGDRCSHDQPGIGGAKPLPPGWKPTVIAGSDCTYGADPGSDSRSWDEEMGKCNDMVVETVQRGSIAVVHGFAIQRGPEVAHELNRRGVGASGLIALDGSCRYYARQQAQFRNAWCELDSPINLRGVQFVDGKRRDELADTEGLAMVTTNGMGHGGASTIWRRYALPDPDAAMIFTGYVAPGTDGHQILKAAAERDRTGQPVNVSFEVRDFESGLTTIETYPLKCHVGQFRLSGHDSRATTLQWFRDFAPEVAVLSHGSKEALSSLESELAWDIPTLIRADQQGMVEIDC